LPVAYGMQIDILICPPCKLQASKLHFVKLAINQGPSEIVEED
jgi:hypothetical protein